MQTSLSNWARQEAIPLSSVQLAQFGIYADLLVEWNQKMNLTAITEPVDIAYKHFADSLYGLPYIPENASLIDVGTGAGFPGVPLKIARPDLSLTLLDSLNKRLLFLNEAVNALSLSDTVTIHSRAEDGGAKKSPLREQFDVSVSRAVSRLNTLAEYCLPYVKVGGVFLAYKGGDAQEEITEAQNAITLLGGELAEIKPYTIAGTDITHSLVVIKKVSPTPEKYPRLQGKIAKQPLL